MQNTKEVHKKISELSELIKPGNVAMLATKTNDGHVRSRPMEACHVGSHGEICFFTQTSDELTKELTDNNHVNLSFVSRSDDDYTSVSGLAQFSKNTDEMVSYWEDRYLRWIPDGLDDPSAVLLKITPVYAEHWSFSNTIEKIAQFIRFGESEPKMIHETLDG